MQHIDAAKILGSKVTMGLMRGLGSQTTMDKDLKELAEAMKPIIEYADKKGVTICLEVEFIDNGLGNPDCVGILWDLFHANIEDIGYERSIKIMGNKLKHIHLADSNRMFPGYGHTDIAAILKMVKNTGYSEYASFECFNLPSLETVLNETGAWVQKMREL